MSRLPFGLLSQMLASGTNFLLLVGLARSQGAEEFGWAALTVALVTAAVGICRSVFGTSIALAADSGRALRFEGSFGASAAFSLVTLTMLPLALWSTFSGEWVVLMILLSAPAIVFQDLLRQVSFSLGQAKWAFDGDVIRIVLTALPVVATGIADVPVFVAIGTWGGSALLAARHLVKRLPWRPFRGHFVTHWRRTSGERLSLLGDSALVQLTPVVASLLVGSALSPVALSAFRGGSTLLGPISILLTAIPLLLMPHIVREGASDFAHVIALLRPVNIGLTSLCVVIAGISLVVPPDLGSLVLGDSWLPTQQILPIMALQFGIQPWTLSVTTGLKLTGLSHLLVPLRVARAVVLIVAVAVAIQSGSIVAVVVTILACEFIAALAYQFTGRRHWNAPLITAGNNSPSPSKGTP